MDKVTLEGFLPNNLSRCAIELTHVDNVVNARVRDVMRRNFGYSDIVLIKAFDHAGILSKNYLVEISDQIFVLKARPGVDCVADRLEIEVVLAERLLAMGVPVPSALRSKNGQYAVEAFGSSWVCFRHCAGMYFQGLPGELEIAARGFANLSAVLRSLPPLIGKFADEGLLVEDLADMVRSTPVPPSHDVTMGFFYSLHRDALLRVISRIATARPMIERHIQVMHTDYHPLNILLQDGKLVAILDFEDIKPYPIAAASGFAAYKLIRQTLVSVPAGNRACVARSLVDQWIIDWSSHLPDLPMTTHALGEGALYRVLGLLHRMFDAWLRKKDNKFNFDFSKQIGSLYEISMIFDLYLQEEDC